MLFGDFFMASRVFVKVGSKVAGPFSLSRIKQLAAQGKINPATPICPEIGGKPNNEWRKAAAIKGVFQNGKIQNEVNTSNKVASPPPRKATAPSPQVSVEEGKSHRYLLIGSVVGIGAFALCAIAFMFWYSSAKKQEKIAAANEKVNQTVILVEDFLNGERSVDIETVEKRLARALENSQATNLKKAEAAESKLKQKKEDIQLEKAAAEQFAKAKKAIDSFKTKAAIRILAEYVENPHAKQQAAANTLLSQATYADSDEAAMKMLLTASDEQFARMQSDTPLPHPEIQNSAILKHWNKTVRKNYNLAVSKRREIAKRRQQREQEEAAWDLERIERAKKIIAGLPDWESDRSQYVIQQNRAYYQNKVTADIPRPLKVRASGADPNFTGAIRPGHDVSGQSFIDLNFSLGDLRCVNFEGCNLAECDFTLSLLQWANLSSTNLKNASLNGVNLSDTKFINANLTSAYLGDADFSRADLHGANLSGCTLSGTDFRLAKNLKSATWDGATYINQDVPLFPEGITLESLRLRGRDRRGDPNWVVCGRCKRKQLLSAWLGLGKCPDCGYSHFNP